LDSNSDVKPSDPIKVEGTPKTETDAKRIVRKTITLAGTGIGIVTVTGT
jgi:hypothetical protein